MSFFKRKSSANENNNENTEPVSSEIPTVNTDGQGWRTRQGQLPYRSGLSIEEFVTPVEPDNESFTKKPAGRGSISTKFDDKLANTREEADRLKFVRNLLNSEPKSEGKPSVK